jgi:hypothetical protein
MRRMINQADETDEAVNLDLDLLEEMIPVAPTNRIRITQQGLIEEQENLPDQTLIHQKEMTKNQREGDSPLRTLLWK